MRKFTKLMLTLALLMVGVASTFATETTIKVKDYSTDATMGWAPENLPEGASREVKDGCLVITNNSDSGNNWDLQMHIADGFGLKENYSYKVLITYKTTKAGYVTVALGTWGDGNSEPKYGTPITENTDFQTLELSFGPFEGDRNGSFVMWQCRSIVGTIYISKVEVIEITPDNIVEPTWTNIIVNSDMEGESAECFYVKDVFVGGPFLAHFTEGIGKDGSKAVKVQTADQEYLGKNDKNEDIWSGTDWDQQFFIRLPYQLPAGTKFKVSFDYKADKSGTFYTQAHNSTPGGYIHWEAIGDVNFNAEDGWKTYEKQGTITADMSPSSNPMQTIAFNLCVNKLATEFIFDNFKFEIDEAVLATLTPNPAQNPRNYPTSMSIVGDFSENGWEPAQGIAMTQDADNLSVWTAVVDDFVVTSNKLQYQYKAIANGNWNDLVIGNPDAENENKNQEYDFNYDGAKAGIYKLTFTANTIDNTVELAVEKKPDIYTVAGTSNLFDSNWNTTDVNNNMTQNNDGTYSITYTDVQLSENVEYKVVKNHTWDEAWPSQNRVIGISMPGTYDITINFNPADGSVWETMAVAKKLPEAGEGYATFCAPYALNFDGTGVQAYFAKSENGRVNFYEISNAPKNTGLLLKADVGTYKLKMETITGEAAANVDGNVLIGVNEETVVNKSGIFVLLNSDKGVGFYKTTAESFTVGANTAYIDINDTARDFIGFDFNGSTTAIEGVATVKENNGEIYNLAGQRVAQPTKGLYIVNGKKVVIK